MGLGLVRFRARKNKEKKGNPKDSAQEKSIRSSSTEKEEKERKGKRKKRKRKKRKKKENKKERKGNERKKKRKNRNRKKREKNLFTFFYFILICRLFSKRKYEGRKFKKLTLYFCFSTCMILGLNLNLRSYLISCNSFVKKKFKRIWYIVSNK